MEKDLKDILLKDLCARLPYGVKVQYENLIFDVEYVCPMYEEVKLDNHETWTICIDEVKPYLFPLSSMTEEQKEEYKQFLEDIDGYAYSIDCVPQIDWLNKNHFDYRSKGLLEEDLAIDATGLNIY